MQTFWIKFNGHPSSSVEAENEESAKKLAAELTGKEVVQIWTLPYPASPRLTKHEYTFTNGTKSVCPTFCHSPEQCKGRTACPQSYSCTE